MGLHVKMSGFSSWLLYRLGSHSALWLKRGQIINKDSQELVNTGKLMPRELLCGHMKKKLYLM